MTDNWCAEVEQGAILLTVNQRLSRHYVSLFSEQLLAESRQWWETPGVLPLSAWLKQVHASCIANGSSDKVLLPDIVAERTWQQVVAADPQASVLLDADLTASNAQKAWRTANAWGLAGSAGQDQSASQDQLAFARWRAAYEKRCTDENFIDTASVATHITTILLANSNAIKLPEKLLLAGFLEIPVQLQNLLNALEKNGVAISFIEPEKAADTKRLVLADDDTAFSVIAKRTRQALEQNPDCQIGVVVHDLQQRRSQVLRAFDNVFFPAHNPVEINTIGRPYDLSIGLPLNEQSVIRTALLFLNLLTKGLVDTELSAFLLSPYLPGTDKDARAREKLDIKCRDERIRHISFFDFIKLLPKGDALRAPMQKISKRKWKGKSGAAVWASHFGSALRDLGWPGKSIDSEEYQCVEAWNACLDDFQILDNGDLLNDKRALGLLTRLCRSRVFQLDTAATPIQIMGRLESHGLLFDKLWVAGLDSDQWPPIAVPTSFISIKQQQSAGVPDSAPQLRLALAESEMALWMRSTDELFLCHAQIRDDLELSPASIIADIQAVEHGAAVAARDVHGHDEAELINTAKLIQSSCSMESIKDTHGPELAVGTKLKGGTRLLENQARCPFKAFAMHRLRIKKLEEAGIGLDPRQHGNLFHHAMELFWQQVGSQQQLLALSTENLDALINTVIEAAIKEYKIQSNLQDLQSRYLYRLISDWIEQVERVRQPFTVTQLEQERTVEISGVGISVKVDRVDELATGETVVIDYKTGQHNAIKTWSEPRIENPQLPLYAGTDPKVEGVCFAQAFPNQNKLIGTTSTDDVIANLKTPLKTRSFAKKLQSWEHARDHWAESLNMLATEIREGVATITPVNKACEFCELPSLCRISNEIDETDDSAEETEWGERIT